MFTKNILYPFKFWANIPISLKTLQGLNGGDDDGDDDVPRKTGP